ncbi:exodeoxyribonuclease V subunit alpha [Gayadomonas joobiniege]|uniref:exodeoxyribonuclease V subunit alpha n=1 Tax=Gayadomonas joobiniege TaxID=1234606 RepID=UPI00036823A2|nr:exodeoxyribonuclease V subunit alpha [Gayadomonas joobiniege]
MYKSFVECQQQLADVEAFDYYFANQICALWQLDDAVVFHMLMLSTCSIRRGHTCLPLTAIANQLEWDNDSSQHSGYQFAEIAELEKSLANLPFDDESFPLVFDGHSLYLRRYWQFEQTVAELIRPRCVTQTLNEQQLSAAQTMLNKVFNQSSQASETDWQAVAVANSLIHQLAVICGGPGTGKTYTVARLLVVLLAMADKQKTPRILMAAPTGKAAQRMLESINQTKLELARCGIEQTLLDKIPTSAATIHRLLGYRPESTRYRYNAERQLPCDILLIDEVSMIDVAMMSRILVALPQTARLIMLGDADQLPSVESGNILADLSQRPHPGYAILAQTQIATLTGYQVPLAPESLHSHVSFLYKTHRFSGPLADLAQAVISRQPKADEYLLHHKRTQASSSELQIDYFPQEIQKAWLKNACQTAYSAVMAADNVNDAFVQLAKFRVLAALRRGEYGTERLNEQIEQWLKEKHRQVRIGQHYQGRPIMINQNDYASGLFNGDTGLIWPHEDGRLMAFFATDEGLRAVSLARLPAHQSVYAMTIHKTQGSEFAHVALVLGDQVNQLMSAELLYTGLTRAKQKVSICGEFSVWRQARQMSMQRYSGLATRLFSKT